MIPVVAPFLTSVQTNTRNKGACHYLTNQPPFTKTSRSLQEGSAKPLRSVSSRRLRGASKTPPRTLRGGLRTLRGGCIYRRLHEDALEGSRGLLEGSVDERHVCYYSMMPVITIVFGQYYTVFFTPYATNIGEPILIPSTVSSCCSHHFCSHLNDLTFFSSFEWMLTGITFMF